MTGKMFRNSFLVGISVLLISAMLFFGVLYRYYESQIFSELASAEGYVESGLALSGEAYLDTLHATDRITWVSSDGTVLYDSAADAASMENHLNREEIQEALKTGTGQSSHISETLLKRTLYYASRLPDGTVLRVACTQHAMASMLQILISPMIWIVILVLMLSGVMAFRLAKQITKPINAIDLDNPSADGVYPELTPLVDRLGDQNRTIHLQMAELSRRQREFTAIADNMSEGFLLLDSKLNILSCNQSALTLLGLSPEDVRSLRGSEEALILAAEEALSGSHAEQLMEREARTWQIIANPVTANGQVSGAVVILMDVTEREQRENLRREFTANVSHELKTPLTSISGFAELMKEGLVPPDKAREFSGDIYRESRRLMDLVEDILNLSKLDEGSPQFQRESVDLYALSQAVLESLRPAAEKRRVTLQLQGESAVLFGVRQILNEMVYNLCDNAIKYNIEGGSVTVAISRGEGTLLLSVSDTGIGIPYGDQGRVFERFYRVDKSHSKEIGGTGLGLSIVKHAAQYHDARISLQSILGQGTKISLTFPL